MKKLYLLSVILLSTAFLQGCDQTQNTENSPCSCRIEVHEGHDKETPQGIVNAVRKAEKGDSIHFALFSLTYESYIDELIKAKSRGAEVEGIVDRSQTGGQYMLERVQQVEDAGIPVKFGDNRGLMHIKLVTVRTHDKGNNGKYHTFYSSGSYNWTKNATTENDEVIEFGYDCPHWERYEQIWHNVYDKNKPADLNQLRADKEARAKKRQAAEDN